MTLDFDDLSAGLSIVHGGGKGFLEIFYNIDYASIIFQKSCPNVQIVERAESWLC